MNEYIPIFSLPVPYFIDCGRTFFHVDKQHISRNQVGVFDLMVVTKGTLHIGEGVTPMDYLLQFRID
ncbi:hypothetical protein [Paenibacillus sp. Soil724D2]|uniref:hypothetical protein n=1 Tax=Paenibacillus sp. (strain Soil724D2) TaxID=1736392 RepID=UPI000713DF56|nr:hypothetical protein [Paenibacillus sp. Soil724D2]KRE36296.1 hypothetical protein ASG85_08935 [Paenibacillus sp. Soil724D2]